MRYVRRISAAGCDSSSGLKVDGIHGVETLRDEEGTARRPERFAPP
jgi:hypothetical protein